MLIKFREKLLYFVNKLNIFDVVELVLLVVN